MKTLEEAAETIEMKEDRERKIKATLELPGSAVVRKGNEVMD